MKRNIIESILAIFISRFGVQLITIVITPILVRMLGSAGYGDYSFLMSTLGAMMVFIYGGAFNGMRKFIAEDRDQPEWKDRIFGFYFQLIVILSVAISILVLISVRAGLISRWLDESFHLYFYIIALIIPIRALLRISRSALMGLNLERYSESIVVIEKILFGVLAIVFIHLGNGVAGALAGKAFALTITALLTFIIVARNIRVRSVFDWPNGIPRKKIMKYTFITMTLKFLMISLYHTDIILLRLFIGSSQTGYYKAALIIAEFLWFVPAAIQLSLLHSTSNLWNNERYEEITAISARAVRYTFLLSLLFGLGIVGLSNQFIPLYFGPDFTPAIGPLILLLPGAIGFAVARPILAISQGQNDLRSMILATGLASGINLLLNLLLIPQLGMSGAAIATSVGYGSMLLFHIWSARQIGFDPISDLRLGRIIITALISAVPILLLPRVISSVSASLLIVPPVGLIVYCSIAFVSRAIDARELSIILNQVLVSAKGLTQVFSK